MPIDPQSLVLALSALASTLSLASSTKNLMKSDNVSVEDAIEQLKTRDAPEQRQALADPTLIRTAKILLVIPHELLDHLADTANECVKKHIRDSERAKTNAGTEKADRAAQECVCSTLRRIIKFNGGKLPDDENLKNLWKAYGCKP